MSKRKLALIILAVFSIGIAIFKAETSYADNPLGYVRGVSYASFPWLVGLIVALIRGGWARLVKKTPNFAGSLVGTTGVMMVLQVAVVIYVFLKLP